MAQAKKKVTSKPVVTCWKCGHEDASKTMAKDVYAPSVSPWKCQNADECARRRQGL